MSEAIYNSLFNKESAHTGNDALVAAFAQLGRLNQAATALANDEMNEGLWVVEEESVDVEARYAADDRSESTATYTGGDYSVLVTRIESAWTAKQLSGQPGASLKIDGTWIVLEPGASTSLPISDLPSTLLLVDLSGREIVLER